LKINKKNMTKPQGDKVVASFGDSTFRQLGKEPFDDSIIKKFDKLIKEGHQPDICPRRSDGFGSVYYELVVTS
jgi:hypothetical protein